MTTGEFVNVYWLDRVEGGFEEGGWWFDVGIPMLSMEVHEWDRVTKLRLIEALRSEFPDNRRRSSVNYLMLPAEEQDYMVTIEDHVARYFPEETPRYE